MHAILLSHLKRWHMHSHSNCRRRPHCPRDQRTCLICCILLLQAVRRPERHNVRDRASQPLIDSIVKLACMLSAPNVISLGICLYSDWITSRDKAGVIRRMHLLGRKEGYISISTYRSILTYPSINIEHIVPRLGHPNVLLAM